MRPSCGHLSAIGRCQWPDVRFPKKCPIVLHSFVVPSESHDDLVMSITLG